MEDRAGAHEVTWLSATQTQAQSHTTLTLNVVEARRVERGASVVVAIVVVVRRSGVVVVIVESGMCIQGLRVVVVAAVVVVSKVLSAAKRASISMSSGFEGNVQLCSEWKEEIMYYFGFV
jgi:hypothetical protein